MEYKEQLLMIDERTTVTSIPESEIIKLRNMAREVERQNIHARMVARLAVHAGFLLIGTTASKDIHYPVPAHEHRYIDLRGGHKQKQYAQDGTMLLQLGVNADIALLCGLFGDINNAQERIDRCFPITGQKVNNFGWGTDVYKTFAQGVFPAEGCHVRPHARPELINRALNTQEPLTGSIDCVFDHESLRRIPHEIGQFVTPVTRETIIRIPLRSDLDLPPDIIATDYADTSSMGQTIQHP